MNRIYKVIWSKARNCYVVVSEIAKTHSKGGTGVSGVVRKAGSAALLTAAVTAMLLTPLGTASAAAVDISSNNDGSATAVFQNSNNSIEVGDNTISASGKDSIAIGTSQTKASGKGSVAIGSRVDASADHATAVGDSANATSERATAVGDGASAEAMDDSAFGSGAIAKGEQSTALGHDTHAEGRESIAGGDGASALKDDDAAYGHEATADGGAAIAIGSGTKATDKEASAVGAGSTATAEDASAFGSGADATEKDATALGTESVASATESTAVGSHAVAEADRSVAIGGGGSDVSSAHASGQFASAVGSGTEASGVSSTALGGGTETTAAKATADGSVAIGGGGTSDLGAHAEGVNSIAVGVKSSADKEDAIAIGTGAAATIADGVALGSDSKANTGAGETGFLIERREEGQPDYVWTSTSSAVSIGDPGSGLTRQITGVAAGTQDTDAANVAQVKAAMTHYYSVKSTDREDGSNYLNDNATGNNALAAGVRTKAEGNAATAMGYYADASAEGSIAIGSAKVGETGTAAPVMIVSKDADGNLLDKDGNIIKDDDGNPIKDENSELAYYVPKTDENGNIVYENTNATGKNSIAIGTNTKAWNENATAMGTDAMVWGDNGTAVGTETQASTNASAYGYQAKAHGEDSTAIGYTTYVSGKDSTAVGSHATSQGPNSTSVGLYATTNGADQTAVGEGAVVDSSAQYGTAVGYKANAKSTSATAVAGIANGYESTAVGKTTTAGGSYSTAVGNNNTAGGSYATAVGYKANGSNSESTAVGYQAQGNGYQGTAVGWSSNAGSSQSTAVGYYAQGTGSQSTAVGYSADANDSQSTAVGYYAQGDGPQSTSVGIYSHAGGSQSSALGYSANANGPSSTAAGYGAVATATDSTALGYKSTANGSESTAVGGGVSASQYSTAVGYTTNAGGSNSTAVGNYNSAGGSYATAVGYRANGVSSESTAVGYQAQGNGFEGTAVGYSANAGNSQSTAVGYYAQGTGYQSTAVGYSAGATSSQATSVGFYAEANGTEATAVGYHSHAGYEGSALGYYANANGSASTAAGYGAVANYSDSTALGYKSTANGSDSTAIGGANTSGTRGVAIGMSAGAGGSSYSDATSVGASAQASNQYATAVGYNADAKQYSATAVGKQAQAQNSNSTAVGSTANAGGDESTAVGNYAQATYSNATAVGNSAKGNNYNATGVGYNANAGGSNSAAVGYLASAWGTNGAAVGYNSGAGENAAALGYGANAYGTNAAALGYGASAGSNAVAAGVSANAWGANGIALGTSANAGNDAVVLGRSAVGWKDDTIVLGKESVSGEDKQQGTENHGFDPLGDIEPLDSYANPTWQSTNNAVSFGRAEVKDPETGEVITTQITRQINNVAAGTLDTDVVNVAQLRRAVAQAAGAGDHYFGADDATNARQTDAGLISDNKITRIHNQQINIIGDSEYTTTKVNGRISDGVTYVEKEGKWVDANGNELPEDAEFTETEVTQAELTKAGNILTSVTEDKYGIKSIKAELNRDLEVDSIMVTGKDGKEGEPGTPGTIGINGRDGTNGLPGEDGETTTRVDIQVGPSGEPGLDGKDGVTRIIYEDGDGEHEVATLDDGLKFGANAGEPVATEEGGEEEGPNPVPNKLNSTVNIVGSEAVEGREYSTENLTTTVGQAEDGTTTITVKMDKDPNFDTLIVNGKDGKDGEPGTPGKIGIRGEPGEDGTPGEVAYISVTNDGTPGVDGKDGEDGITRIVYTDPKDPDKPIEVATLDDGMKYSGDFGNTKDNPVAVKLNKNVDVVGNSTAASADDLTDGNIGVVAEPETDEETGEATGNAKLTIKLNKDINLGTDGSLTVGGEVDEEGNPKTDEYGNPTSIVIGPQTVNHVDGSTEEGDFIVGLDNTNWDPTNIVSGRAATEDQLAAAQTHYYSVNDNGTRQDNWLNDGATGINSLAAGTNAKASGITSTAVGHNANASVMGAVALGSNSVADRPAATESGYDVTTGTNYDRDDKDSATWKATTGALSLGGTQEIKTKVEPGTPGAVEIDGEYYLVQTVETTRQITGVAAGLEDTDAVNVAQLKRLENAMQIHDYSVNSVEPGKDLNYDNKGATGDNAMAAGVNAIAEAENATAVGNMAIARNKNSTAVGNMALASADSAAAFGDNAQATIKDSVAIGSNSIAAAGRSDGGYDVIAGGKYTDDTNAWSSTAGAVSVGGGNNADGEVVSRQIKNVAAGYDDTDAVNVAQLKRVGQAIEEVDSRHTTVSVGGVATTADDTPVTDPDGNLTLERSKNENGAYNYDLKLARDLDVDTIVVNGKDGAPGEPGLTIKGQDGAPGAIGIAGEDGEIKTITITENGEPGVDGKDGITRIIIDDKPVATLDDGMKYTGDFGDGAAVKLNKTVNVVGEAKNENDLTTGNIGVVAEQDGENGKLTVKLNKDINLGEEGSVTMGDTVINNEGMTITNGGPEGDIVINKGDVSFGGNQIHNVAPGEADTDVVNVSQLKEYSGAARTEVTVNEGTAAPDDQGTYTNDGGNLQLRLTKAADGHDVFDVKLSDDITIGGPGKDGKDGVDGHIGVDGKDGVSGVGIDGKDGITVYGKDGKDGEPAVAINGKDGVGHIGLAGPAGKDGKDGVSDIHMIWGEPIVGKDGAPGTDGITRIEYTDPEGNPHQVATTDDGLYFGANTGDPNPAPNRINSRVNIMGAGTKDDDSYSGENLKTIISQTGEGKDAVTTINVVMDRDLNVDNIAVNGKDGKDGAPGTAGHIGVDGRDGEAGVGIDGKDGITVTGKDGKDGVTIYGKDGENGTEGHIGLTGQPGKDGKDAKADITVKEGPVGVDGTDGADGKDGMDRIVYEDHNGTEHEVATLDDGMKYSGDFGNTKDDPVPVKLNNNVDIVGNSTAASEDELSDGNIGVVAKPTEDGGAQLVVKLNKNIDLTEEGSVTMGDTVINNEGLTINNGGPEGDIVINKGDVSFGGNVIHNVAPGVEDNDVVNVSQLKEVEQLASQHSTVTVDGSPIDTDVTDGNLLLTVTKEEGKGTNYDLKLNDNIELGGPGKDGKDGKDGSIGVNGADGKSGVGIDGKDGISVRGTDGKDGVTIYAKNGEDGKDGSEGHIGLAGKNGKDGKDGVTDIYTKWGDPTPGTYGKDGKDGTDGITRIVYTDPEGDEHQVATMDDGLKFGANSGDPNPAVNKLSSTVEIKGAGEKDDDSYTGKNLKTIISQEGEGKDAVTTINVVMDKDLETETLVVNGKDGKDGEPGTPGRIGIDGKDGEAGIGIDGKDGITITGKDGKDGVSIRGVDGKDGTEGHIGLAGRDGKDADIFVGKGDPGVDGKDGITRIIYQDPSGEEPEIQVATLEDGMKYGGDFGDGAAVKLNKTVNVVGEAKNEADLTTGNIGVVAAQDGDNGKLTVKLNKDIDLGDKGSVKMGDTTINNDGLTINEGPSVTKNGIDAGSKKITNVAPGEADTDAVNVSQLKDFAGDVNKNIGDVNNRINRLGDRVDKVGAGAAALAGLHPLDFDPDAKWDVAAGYGHYRGENAVAVGAFYRPSEDVMVNVASTVGNGDNMISAGVSVKVGGNTHVSNSRVALSKQVLEMRKEIEDMRSLMADSAFGKQLDLSKLQLFPDTPENHWAYDYVATLAGNGLLEGYPDGNFKGDRALTRYEVAAILYRAMMNGAQLTQRALEEFAPELDRIRVDTLTRHSDGTPSIQRVRIIKDRR